MFFLVIFFFMNTASIGERDLNLFLKGNGLQYDALHFKDVTTSKDAAVEWYVDRKNSVLFSQKKSFSEADNSDLEYFRMQISKTFQIRSIDSSYRLYRGDVVFGDGACASTECNAYILESESESRVYGGFYSQ